MNPRLLLIESGKESYRAFTLAALQRDGVDVVLAAKAAPTWQRAYIADFVEADPDAPEFPDRVRASHRGRPVDGVLTFVERLVPLAAAIARDLGLPGLGAGAAVAVRDKLEMRRRLAGAGLPSPRSASLAAARAGAADLMLPVVVKPVMGFASLNVIRLDDWSRLAWIDEVIAKDNHSTLPDPGAAYLVEEYIAGPEYSVESCVSGDAVVHYGVTRKVTSREPYFEEIAHVTPAPLSPGDHAAMLRTTEIALRALGVDHCVTHTEIRLCPRRGPVVIEVAARLGGDKIPRLVELSTGASPSLAAGRAALGRPLPPARPAERAAGIAFFVPRGEAVAWGALDGRPDVEGLVELECSIEVGARYQVPPEHFFTRLGYALVEAPSAALVAERLARVIAHVEAATGIALEGGLEAAIA